MGRAWGVGPRVLAATEDERPGRTRGRDALGADSWIVVCSRRRGGGGGARASGCGPGPAGNDRPGGDGGPIATVATAGIRPASSSAGTGAEVLGEVADRRSADRTAADEHQVVDPGHPAAEPVRRGRLDHRLGGSEEHQRRHPHRAEHRDERPQRRLDRGEHLGEREQRRDADQVPQAGRADPPCGQERAGQRPDRDDEFSNP